MLLSEDSLIFHQLAGGLCILGVVGIAATSCLLSDLCRYRVATKLSAADRQVEGTSVIREGSLLHRQVPMERWCVTRSDLLQFRRLVQSAVLEGRIVPTELDPFDPQDAAIGPNIHTVNEQYIKPVTMNSGGASWALMLHPQGLPCDVFVTHSWAEGVYEFVDKVLYSWPRGARHAYCCMLCNPQNSGIDDLIASPHDSPFSKALHKAKHLLVVPNRAGSVYTRIWCAYEAFLGYRSGKLISTASAPVGHFWPHVLRCAFVCILGLGAGGLVIIFTRNTVLITGVSIKFIDGLTFLEGVSAAAWVWLFLLWACLRSRPSSAALRYVLFAVDVNLGFSYAALAMKLPVGLPPGVLVANLLILFVATTVLPGAGEADRLWAVEAAAQTEQLRKGFTGRLRDAQCSVPADGERIRRELEESGTEADVDKAVRVLIQMGMSSPQLREAMSRAGVLGSVGTFSHFFAVAGLLVWLGLPLEEATWGGCEQWSLQALVALEGMAWVMLMAKLPPDRRAFAAASQLVVFSAVPVVVLEQAMGISSSCTALTWLACGAGPLAVVLSLMGPARVVRLPLLGPALTRALLGAPQRQFTLPRGRTLAALFRTSERSS